MGYLCQMRNIGRYSKWVTLVAAIILVASCFMPWSYYPDLGRSFTGWRTEQNVYAFRGNGSVSWRLSLCWRSSFLPCS